MLNRWRATNLGHQACWKHGWCDLSKTGSKQAREGRKWNSYGRKKEELLQAALASFGDGCTITSSSNKIGSNNGKKWQQRQPKLIAIRWRKREEGRANGDERRWGLKVKRAGCVDGGGSVISRSKKEIKTGEGEDSFRKKKSRKRNQNGTTLTT